jgi:hypothetical protein
LQYTGGCGGDCGGLCGGCLSWIGIESKQPVPGVLVPFYGHHFLRCFVRNKYTLEHQLLMKEDFSLIYLYFQL